MLEDVAQTVNNCRAKAHSFCGAFVQR